MICAERALLNRTEASGPQQFAGWSSWPKRFLKSWERERHRSASPFSSASAI
jgi:hypothetical protein